VLLQLAAWRLALGATSRGVIGLFVKQSARQLTIGPLDQRAVIGRRARRDSPEPSSLAFRQLASAW
jgi:hypothetical protein